MPSEQSIGQPKFTSDIYAVGIIGIQALTGIIPDQLPKDPNTSEIIWRNHAQVSPELADILDKMVCYHFCDRFQSAAEALQSLRALSPTNVTPPQPVNTPISASTAAPTLPPLSNFLPKLSLALILVLIAVLYIFRTPITKLIGFKAENLLPYASLSERIKINYPESWKKQEINNPITGEVITFVSPKQSDADNFLEKITITVEDFTGTLEEFSNSSIKDINHNLQEAKIIKTSEQIIANKQGEELIYTANDGDKTLKNLQVFTLKNGKAYVITYTAKIENYKDFIELAETMIKSFEIQ